MGFDVERVIRNAIIQVLQETPFYGHIICQMPKRYTELVKTLAVGKDDEKGLLINLYINPKYVEGIYKRAEKERAFKHIVEVIKHEVIHVIFRHVFIEKKDTKRQGNAMELSVNSYIDRKKLVDKGVFPEDFKFPEKLSFEKYYSMLEETKELEEDFLDDHGLWEHLKNDEVTEIMLKDMVRKAKENAEETGAWSKVHSEIRDQVGVLLETKEKLVSWQTVLRDFVASSSETVLDYTNKKKSKRYGTRPGTIKEDKLRLAVGIDTSGSVDKKFLDMFFSELHWISKETADITIYECDECIQRSYPFRFFDGTVKGRGGTDLEPVIKEAAERKFDALIYFTDGNAFPIKNRYNIRCLFVICGFTIHKSKGSLPYPGETVFRVKEDDTVEIW